MSKRPASVHFALLFACILAAPALWSPAHASGGDDIAVAFIIDSAHAKPARAFEAFDTGSIATIDLDGDGVLEIVVHNDNNRAYVFRGDNGTLVQEIATNLPERWGARELAGIAVGDVNGNGRYDLVIANSAGVLTAYEARTDGDLQFEMLWERRMDPRKEDPTYMERNWWVDPEVWPGLDGAPYLADVTGDGKDEIFLQIDDMPGLWGLDGDGETRWFRDWGDGNANPVAADLTGNGKIEAVFVDDGGRVFIFDAKSGVSRCTFQSRDHGPHPASISISPGLADLTGDGRLEIVFGARNAVEDRDDPQWYMKQHAHFFAIDADCNVVWHKNPDWANPHVHTRPVFHDVTGDGRPDVIWQDWNTVGHKPGNFESTGRSNLFALDGQTGKLLWRHEVGTYWSNTNLAVADVTGDGEIEVVYVAPKDGIDGVRLKNLQGEDKGFLPTPGWEVSRGAVVVDLDGDGNLEVIVPMHRKSEHCAPRNIDVGCREGALKVFKTGSTAAPIASGIMLFNEAYDYGDKVLRSHLPTPSEGNDTPPRNDTEEETPSTDGPPRTDLQPPAGEESGSDGSKTLPLPVLGVIVALCVAACWPRRR